MLSFHGSRCSLKEGLKAVFLIEDVERKPMSPLKGKDYRSTSECGVMGRNGENEWFKKSGVIKDSVALREGNEKDTIIMSADQPSVLGNKGCEAEERSRQSISISEGKDALSLNETLPDFPEEDSTKDDVSESETHPDSDSGVVKGSLTESICSEDEPLPPPKDCCPFGTWH